MDIQILGFLKKGTKIIAKVEVEEGNDKVIVPVVLKVGMLRNDFLNEVQRLGQASIDLLRNPPPPPPDIPVITTPADIEALRDSLIGDIKKKIKLN